MSNLKKDRILSVDDVQDNLDVVRTLLESEGYHVDSAINGTAALRKVTAFPPDLIILDVMMPGIDGYEVTRRIRNNPEINYIPILLLTAYNESSVVKGLDVGADDFNMKLSDGRAASVKNYLVSKGISAERLESEGFGESMPVADNKTI